MRLRLSIQRNGLPPVKTWFAVEATADPAPTISKLLEQVNDLVPLEAESWGLEDYVVTIGGYECLHYSKIKDVVKENDRICIRPLSTPEYRTRTLSGRHQINASGQHLTDGIPFGRPLIRQPNRPAIHIPPRKRRRLELDADVSQDNGQGGHEVKLLQNGVVAEADEEEDSDSEEDDEDFDPGDSADDLIESEDDSEDEAEEAAEDHVHTSSISPQLGLRQASTGQKRRRSVSFSKLVDVEKDSHSILAGSSSSELDDSSEESEEDSDSESDTSSSDDDGSEDGDDRAPARPDEASDGSSDSDTSSEATSEDDEGSASSAEKQLQADSKRKLHDLAPAGASRPSLHSKPPVPPGEGKKETQKRNLRRRQKRRLYNMIKIGKLPPDATVSDLEALSITTAAVRPTDALSNQSTGVDDLEFQRQRLLQQLAEGGVEVTTDITSRPNKRFVKAEEQRTDPSSSTVGLATKGSSDLVEHLDVKLLSTGGGDSEDDPADDIDRKRPRLNLASSNRLIFGSLGVRTPKTKDDGEKVREKLAARSQAQRLGPDTPQVQIMSDTQDAVMTEDTVDVTSDAWKSRIKLKAVECVDEGVALSQPPYPFVQCWDEQYAWNRPSDNKKKRKKKRKSQASEYQGEDGSLDAGWAEDAYDVDLTATAEPTGHINFGNGGKEEAIGDDAGFPSMPADATALPALAAQYCNPGIYVLLKELHVDASTKWRPEISDWRLARVDENLEGNGIKVTLAPQHRVAETLEYDTAGKRVRQGFEMPDSDDDHEEGDDQRVDNGVREIALESLMEIRLLKAADPVLEAESATAQDYGDKPLPLSGINGSDVLHTNGDTNEDSDIVWEGIGDEAEDAY